MQLYDASGKPLSQRPPIPLTATFCRSAHYQGPTRHDVVVEDGKAVTQVKNDLVRAQVSHLVRLLVYRSKFQMQPDEREYFVYAPMDYKSSVKLVMQLWRRWEKPRKAGWEFVEEDVTDNMTFSTKHNIQSVPAFLVYEDGIEVDRWVGPNPLLAVEPII